MRVVVGLILCWVVGVTSQKILRFQIRKSQTKIWNVSDNNGQVTRNDWLAILIYDLCSKDMERRDLGWSRKWREKLWWEAFPLKKFRSAHGVTSWLEGPYSKSSVLVSSLLEKVILTFLKKIESSSWGNEKWAEHTLFSENSYDILNKTLKGACPC